jgi:fumarate hydratase class I
MNVHDGFSLLDFGGEEEYRQLDLPRPEEKNGCVHIKAESLAELSSEAFAEIAFRFPRGHLELLSSILKDEKASANEKVVAGMLIRNAVIASEGILPLCQDTGTALVYGWKGEKLLVAEDEGLGFADSLAKGAARTYSGRRLRASQLGPESALTERNTGNNLPASVDIRATSGKEFRLLFAAKGGGSTSRTSLSMESPSILRKERLEKVLQARIKALGAAGCPPYTIAMVLGGTTPSQTLYMMELAALGLLDKLPESARADGSPLRDREWESIAMRLAEETRIGGQWGGRYLALETRFIRLSRHAANLPLAVGVSCSAHRKARAFVNSRGWFLEKMEEDPARFLPAEMPVLENARQIDLNGPKEKWLEELRSLPSGSAVELSGTVTLARDAAHKRILSLMAEGGQIPDYFIDHPVFYAGPTEPAPGAVTGSFGPTTASRMDDYLPAFMPRDASLVTIAKGGRGAAAQSAIAAFRGVYLSCVGGAAALLARDHVKESRIVDHADLGMEAVRLVRVYRMPAVVVIDARGSNFYS